MFPYCFYIGRTFLCYVRGPLMTNNSNGNESGIFFKVSKSSSSLQTSCHIAAVHSVMFSITSFAFYEPDSNVCCCLVGKSCPTLLQCCGLQPSQLLCPWDSQARILEWVTMSFSRGSPNPGLTPDSPASCIGRWISLSHLGSPQVHVLSIYFGSAD